MNDLHPILQFISTYGYWIAIPIMIFEGPVITIVMGFLASLGLFNILIVIALGAISDLISDLIYYWSGYHGGPRVLEKLKIPQVHQNNSLQELKERFEKHPGKIFFGVKVLTGLAHSTFVLAGVTRVNYGKILRYSVPGGLIWSTGLAVLGYYFGKNATDISKLLTRTGIILFSALAAVLFYKFWFGKYIARKYAVWKERNNGNQN
ncbi:MAG: DedA family protein [Candidatus Doudnabacteria bacterium]|nr:DedA family protein [Candidatus Doudnabacteria bacterium]